MRQQNQTQVAAISSAIFSPRQFFDKNRSRDISEVDEKVNKLRNQFRVTRNKKKFCKASTSKVSDQDI
jgi:hypothetical protein